MSPVFFREKVSDVGVLIDSARTMHKKLNCWSHLSSNGESSTANKKECYKKQEYYVLKSFFCSTTLTSAVEWLFSLGTRHGRNFAEECKISQKFCKTKLGLKDSLVHRIITLNDQRYWSLLNFAVNKLQQHWAKSRELGDNPYCNNLGVQIWTKTRLKYVLLVNYGCQH